MMDAFFKGGRPSAPKEKTDKSKTEPKHVPWVEKYRPRTIDDVAQQDEVVAVLKKTLQGSDVPNMLFYGPPGTGKTSTILAASRELFGADMFKSRILELNASDERGINVVREKVKNFSEGAASSKRPDGKPCPPFKIVILDEADSMTNAAQAALRRTMEKQTRTTRFCLICNYVSRIIEPITSRCAKFRFKPLDGVVLENRLKYVGGKEEVKYTEQAIKKLMQVSEGDLRKAITLLQSAHRLKGETGIDEIDISEIAGVIPDEVVSDLVTTCESNSYEKLETCVKNLIAEGHSAYTLINQLHDVIVFKNELNDHQKSVICEKIGVVDKRLMDGADEYLQVMDLGSVIMQQICSPDKK
ncbi:replication factor C subunit 4-like [Tubulanus polymorphus]|uniref:replication factor C subunit 4-like n=1 Tax=Tubulanus polymorphus TaxID=672921 RepID=UPI003DA58765